MDFGSKAEPTSLLGWSLEANTDNLGIALPKTEGNSISKPKRNIWEMTERNIVEQVVPLLVTAL